MVQVVQAVVSGGTGRAFVTRGGGRAGVQALKEEGKQP